MELVDLLTSDKTKIKRVTELGLMFTCVLLKRACENSNPYRIMIKGCKNK